MAERKDYEVGYGKPPRQTRFNAGQSGNPKGRPKGARGVQSEVREVLSMPVVLKTAGKGKSVSTLRAVLLRLRQKALEGDQRAIKQCLELGMLHLSEGPEKAQTLTEAEQGIFDLYFRLRTSGAQPSQDDAQEAAQNEENSDDAE